ncbi:MAG: hypothetical protein AAGA71_17275 [Pseudomonadota bacterium]
MNEIQTMAQSSKVPTNTIIIESCNSGAFGESAQQVTTMSDGMTLMGSSTRDRASMMSPNSMSVFSSPVVAALEGGAANTRGHVSASSIYAYVDASLGEWSQRPIYKSHAKRVDPRRNCAPQCTDMELREIVTCFLDPKDTYAPSQEHEETTDVAVGDKFTVFKQMKKSQTAGLLSPVDPNQMDLYGVAMSSEKTRLPELGRFYHAFVTNRNI